jgi:hypothetical protein
MVEILRPIERSFKDICNEDQKYLEFFYIYMASKHILQKDYYPFIKDVEPFMTDHGFGHIERILTKLFYLLRPQLLTDDNPEAPMTRATINTDRTSKKLNAFEVYLLLCSVLWHDIGNLYGRLDHEKNVKNIFKKAKDFLHDDTSYYWIEGICKGHSGKDAIQSNIKREVVNEKDFTCYPRFLAAILRLADELDEDKSRIGERVYEKIPPQKEAYWFFCKCNDSIKIEPDIHGAEMKKIVIEGKIDKNDLFRKIKKEIKKGTDTEIVEVIGIEEYINRVNKINDELNYCYHFLKDPHYYKPPNKIELRLRVFENHDAIDDITADFDKYNGYKEFFEVNRDKLNNYRN